MNSNIQGNNSPTTDSESVSRIERLERVVNEQSETIEELTKERNELEQTVQSHKDEIDELRQELTDHQERSGRKIAETLKKVNQLQESLGVDSHRTTPKPRPNNG
jgi:predicted RNase H-like nuclease (RuvC/YqgF family)